MECARAIDHVELKVSDRAELKKGDWRKGVVAGNIRKRTLVDNGWLAERLETGARKAVSRIPREG